MKAIKAISAALLSLMTISGAHAQQVTKKKVVTTTATTHQTTPAVNNTKTEVIVKKKNYSGYRPYYYDKGTRRYYKVTEGKRVYYSESWTPR